MRASWGTTRAAMLMIVASLAVGSTAKAQEREAAPVLRLTPAELTWTAGSPMLPPRATITVIEGAFDKPGPFTVRLKFPADYRIPAHWHPIRATVISGTFHMGLGDAVDLESAKTLPAGSVFEMPATIHHFGWTSEETIIQEHGIGPLSVNYLDPGKHGGVR